MNKDLERLIEIFDSYDWGLLPIQDDECTWSEFQSLVSKIDKQLEENNELRFKLYDLEDDYGHAIIKNELAKLRKKNE